MINTSNTSENCSELKKKGQTQEVTTGVAAKFASAMNAQEMIYPTRDMIAPQVMVDGSSITIKTHVIDSIDTWKVRYHLYEADGVTPVFGKYPNETGKFDNLPRGRQYIVRTTATARDANTKQDQVIESEDITIDTKINPLYISSSGDISLCLGKDSNVISRESILTVSDPDGGPLTVSCVSDDPSVSVAFTGCSTLTLPKGASGNITYRVISTSAGLASLRFTVTNGRGDIVQTFVNVSTVL